MVSEREKEQRVASAGEVNAIVSAFLLTFAGLFPIVNPLEAAPFFLGLTAGLPATERHLLARKVAVNGFALLLGSMALGPWMLEVWSSRRSAGSCSPRSSGPTTGRECRRRMHAGSAASIHSRCR